MPDSIGIWFSPLLDKLTETDRRRLETGILRWIFDQIDTQKEFLIAHLANDWLINIRDSSESNLNEFSSLTQGNLRTGIPHGITRKTIKQIDVFVPNIGGIFGIQQAFDAISHEIDHMMISILVDIGVLPPRSIRRYRDKLAPAGSEGNTEVVIVHDRDVEDSIGKRPRRVLRIAKWNFRGLQLGGFQLSGIDITDLINLAEKR